MDKGSLFLLFAMLLVIITVYLLFFQYERPPEPEDYLPPLSEDTPRGPITEDCEYDVNCFIDAIKDDCRIVTFLLPDPFNESNHFNGNVIGKLFDKCEVFVSDYFNNLTMRCNIDPDTFSEVGSFEGLLTACSGDLLDGLV